MNNVKWFTVMKTLLTGRNFEVHKRRRNINRSTLKALVNNTTIVSMTTKTSTVPSEYIIMKQWTNSKKDLKKYLHMQRKTVEETKKYHLVITSSDSYKWYNCIRVNDIKLAGKVPGALHGDVIPRKIFPWKIHHCINSPWKIIFREIIPGKLLPENCSPKIWNWRHIATPFSLYSCISFKGNMHDCMIASVLLWKH